MKLIPHLLFFSIILPLSALRGNELPNVIIFLMDDMGYGDCRAYNPESKVAMPNLEQLATDGMLFTDAHSPSAVCAPSRYSILTGNYPWRGRLPNGTWLFHQPSQVLAGQETIAHVMKRAGYATAFLGKVHLGGRVFSQTTGQPIPWKFDYTDIDFTRRIEQTPASFGFDYAYELPQGIQGPPYLAFENGLLIGNPSELRIWEAGVHGNSRILKTGFGAPDWDSSQIGLQLTKKALGFIDQHAIENRKTGTRRPFLMHYCSQACHVPHSPPVEFDGIQIKGAAGDAHLDMLIEADVTLGKIVERLGELGELDNTLIIFTSDNGGLSRGKPGKSQLGHNSCEGLRGSKAQIFEGGHRVPLIARWGNGNATRSHIKPGSRVNAIVGLQDIYATLSELTGQVITPAQGLDSASFLPTLQSKDNVESRSTLLVQANDGKGYGQRLMKMVREGSWKLIATQQLQPVQLYNLADDLLETNNLIDDPAQQTRVKRMVSELNRIIKSKRSTVALTTKRPKPETKSRTTSVEELFQPRSQLKMKLRSTNNGTVKQIGNQWQINGQAPMKVAFTPVDNDVWNLSNFRLLGVPMLNQDGGVTTVDGRLNNGNLTNWSHHAIGFGVAPAAEPTTLGFPFPVVEERYQGPAVFRDQLAKPNGHRVHWRRFYPEDVRALTLDIKSSTGQINLLIDNPFLAWPASSKLDAKLQEMPYLDQFGQVRAVDWPGKAANIGDIRKILNQESKVASMKAKNRRLSQYGGWLDGPRLNATGHFRTQKVEGKWWFVDPDGYLFFSVGACLAGHESETAINQKRLDANFFAYLPGEKDYLRWAGRRKHGNQEFVNYPAINYQRSFGENWKKITRNGIHNRMRAWGVNTLGAWSDPQLQQDRRTPFTMVASIWWQANGHRKFPSPFRVGFEDDLRETIRKFSWAKDNPYCLGVFLGNELAWPDRLTPKVFELPKGEPTKQWVLAKLKKKYPQLADLNAAWKTSFQAWDLVLAAKPNPIPQSAFDDIEPLYFEFATAFFAKCKNALNDILPGKLYLGCRTHRGPNVLGRAAADYVDAFSVNVYDKQVRSWQIPNDIDIPILASEFHFGAVGRGVPSPGLSSAWNQRQRGLAFTHYLASALADPRFVGVHWFQWIDQSAAGRKDRENHQIGFVDVTGRSYAEFVQTVSRATQAMYPARASDIGTTEKILEQLVVE